MSKRQGLVPGICVFCYTVAGFQLIGSGSTSFDSSEQRVMLLPVQCVTVYL